jgi:hypothetical protein
VTWLPSRLHDDRDIPMWIALATALVLTVQPGRTSAVILGALALLVVTTLAARRWRLGWLGIAVLLAVGIGLRAGVPDHGASDVLDVTSTALKTALQGFNPWGHGFSTSRPPGAPFPYGPMALFWYLPAIDDPRSLELFVSCAILALLAVRGRPVGLAIYATAPTLVLTASDGSNDTSAGFLILLALVVAARRPWAGAAILALAVAFKPYAAAWAPALLVYGGIPAFQAFLATSIVVWAPSLLSWGPTSYLKSLQLADLTHNATYWSFGVIYEQVFQHGAPRDLLNKLRLLFGGAVAMAAIWRIRTIDHVIIAGVLVFLIVMFGGYWGSYAYLGAIAPILCWRIDDWLRIPAPEMVASAPWAPRMTPAR